MQPIESLEGKRVALVGLGISQVDFAVGIQNGKTWDEVWTINSAAAVYKTDRMFMLDPASRFFDSDDAGKQTGALTRILPKADYPIYTCELDERVPSAVVYPIEAVCNATRCAYLNNTVAYAIAFALYNKIGHLQMFGVDFGYKGNLYFAEAGRACTEFWLSKCMSDGMKVEVAQSSYLLDAAVPAEEKLYGYHRLDDPLIVLSDNEGNLQSMNRSEVIKNQEPEKEKEPVLIDKNDTHLKKNEPVEPNKW